MNALGPPIEVLDFSEILQDSYSKFRGFHLKPLVAKSNQYRITSCSAKSWLDIHWNVTTNQKLTLVYFILYWTLNLRRIES